MGAAMEWGQGSLVGGDAHHWRHRSWVQGSGSRPGQKHATRTGIMAGPAGLKSLLGPDQAWLEDGSRTPPTTAITIGAKEDKQATLPPLYEQLPLSTCYSDGVSHTRQTHSVWSLEEEQDRGRSCPAAPEGRPVTKQRASAQMVRAGTLTWVGRLWHHWPPGKPRAAAPHCSVPQTSLGGSCYADELAGPTGREPEPTPSLLTGKLDCPGGHSLPLKPPPPLARSHPWGSGQRRRRAGSWRPRGG